MAHEPITNKKYKGGYATLMAQINGCTQQTKLEVGQFFPYAYIEALRNNVPKLGKLL